MSHNPHEAAANQLGPELEASSTTPAWVSEPEMVTISFAINGTDTNPYARWGLKYNPFPGTPYKELMRGALQLNSLGGEPVKSEADIRERLAGFAPDFVERVIDAWRPGEIVRITVTFPRSRHA